MTRRVTLRIDRITLPAGATLDRAAFAAALSHAIGQDIAAGAPALEQGRSAERLAAPARSLRPEGLAAATVGALGK
jgi:hypothetical protein